MTQRIPEIDSVIRSRKTAKMLLPPDSIDVDNEQWNDSYRRELESMLEVAAWAPFHRKCHEQTHRSGALDSVVPWRFHIAERAVCHALIDFLKVQANEHPDSKWSRAWQSKITHLLAATGVLIQVTWLPEPAPEPTPKPAAEGENRAAESVSDALSINNIEHVAAASAAVQNLLLAAESRGWQTYWSSGGILRDADVFRHLGIGSHEALLGSLFLSPFIPEGARVMAGGLRDQRGGVGSWSRWL